MAFYKILHFNQNVTGVTPLQPCTVYLYRSLVVVTVIVPLQCCICNVALSFQLMNFSVTCITHCLCCYGHVIKIL